jgi:MFS family permease
MTEPALGNEKQQLMAPRFLWLLAANLGMWIAIGSFYLFPLFVVGMGGAKVDIGILMGVMPLVSVLVRPWASEMVDRGGRRPVLAAGCALMGGAVLACLFFQGPIASVFYPHLLLRIVFGVGFSLGMVASFTLAADLTPHTRLNEGLGIFGTMGLLGAALGPITAEWLIFRFGFWALFTGAGVMFGVALIFIALIGAAAADPHPARTDSFLATLRYPTIFWLALIGLCFGIGFAAQGGFVAPYAQSKGMLASTYFAAYSTAAIIARLIGGRLSDRLGEQHVIPVALIAGGLGFALLIPIGSVAGLMAAGFLSGIGHGLIVPTLLAAGVRGIPAHGRGKATGVLTGGLDTGLSLGSILLGQIGDWFGYPALFATAVAGMGVGLVLWWLRRLREISSCEKSP